MGVSVVGGATSSGGGLTPFDPSFGYNFPNGSQGQTVSLDMQSNIPAGTYTIDGKANYKGAPARVQLLDSNGNIVGSANLTYDNGSYGTANSSTYSGTVVASTGFSKIKFLGTTSGSPVVFPSAAPTAPLYHVKLSAGVRNLTAVTLADLFISDPNTLSYTNNPTAMPSGSGNPFMTFFYNGKTYVVTSTVAPGTDVASIANTIKIYAWDHVAGSWSGMLASMSPTVISMNSYAAPGTAGNYYASVFPFKNGKILFKYNYWFNQGSSGRGQLRFFTFDTTNNTFSGSSSYDTNATGAIGSAAYNPTEDAWYVMSRAVYNAQGGYYETVNKIWKFKNDYSMESMNYVNNISNDPAHHIIMCENKANPKFVAIGNENGQSTTYRAVWYGSWTANGTYSGNAYDMGNAGSGNTYPFFVNQSKQITIQTTLFGVANSILAVNSDSSSLSAWGGPYTFPSSQIANSAETGYTGFNAFSQKSNPVFSGTVYQRWTIQPINSTQTALVIQDNDYSQGFGTFGVRAVPLPSSATV